MVPEVSLGGLHSRVSPLGPHTQHTPPGHLHPRHPGPRTGSGARRVSGPLPGAHPGRQWSGEYTESPRPQSSPWVSVLLLHDQQCSWNALIAALRTWNLISTRMGTSSLSSLKHHVSWVARSLAESTHAHVSGHAPGPHLWGDHDVLLGSHHALHGHHHAWRAHRPRVSVEPGRPPILARNHAHGSSGIAHQGGLAGHCRLCW